MRLRPHFPRAQARRRCATGPVAGPAISIAVPTSAELWPSAFSMIRRPFVEDSAEARQWDRRVRSGRGLRNAASVLPCHQYLVGRPPLDPSSWQAISRPPTSFTLRGPSRDLPATASGRKSIVLSRDTRETTLPVGVARPPDVPSEFRNPGT